MKSLEKEYEVHRFDIKTSEKKIFKKYTDTIKAHKKLDIRLEEARSNQLLSIKEFSIHKIFSLICECPEEYILFLYLSKNRHQKNYNKQTNIPILDSSEINNELNSSDIRLDTFDAEGSSYNTENIKENKNLHYCIFSILYFIMASLLGLHILKFLFSKEVRILYIL